MSKRKDPDLTGFTEKRPVRNVAKHHGPAKNKRALACVVEDTTAAASAPPKGGVMPRIPEEDIDRIKRDTDLAALVRSRGIELRKHGNGHLAGCCPFHEDEEPSLIVTPARGLFHCMGCGAAGNAIQFVEKFDGVSFRHAFELLCDGRPAFTAPPGGVTKQTTVPRLDNPLDPQADDATLLDQVVDYYHEELLRTPDALTYLEKRGLKNDELIERFRLGFADRTLGLRLPAKNRKDGAALRARLQQLGILRESGHELMSGSLTVPVFDEAGRLTEMYGRKIVQRLRRGTPMHMYLPGPHAGVWNPEALSNDTSEVILCEAPLDALTFWVNGFRNVTFIYGCQGFTDELLDALLSHHVKAVHLAYDADEAGNRAAERDVERLAAHGIAVYRVKFPHGMDANEYATKVQPAVRSLQTAVQSAEPLHVHARAGACSSILAASLAATSFPPEASPPSAEAANLAAEEKKQPVPPPDAPEIEQRGEYRFLSLGNPSAGLRACREYRVGGLEKNNSLEVMKVAVRLRQGETFHLDSIDLLRDPDRRRFIERAADETGIEKDIIKRDLGKLLLALEREQEERLSAALQPETGDLKAELTNDERAEALAFLRSPNLVDRVAETFEACGLVGEAANRLAAYLACTSRKLARPLAVIIQSTSAAGKSALMEAVLSMFPEEDRVKYSAMTGQSLYYLGETNLKHRILAIVEEEGAEKASYALKLLQSEGELTIASTGKDPATGRMETQEYHVEGPVMIFLTTTAIDIDEELQNRCLTLAVDESREQTERIHTLQRQARTLEGLRLRKRRERLLALMRNAQRLLEPLDVVNPYADALTFTAERTRTRRDHEKYLTLIDAIALLHQHQRPRQDDGDGGSYITTTLADIQLANQLAPELLGRSLDELPPQTRRLLTHAKTIVRDLCKAQEIEQRLALFTRRDLRELTGWSEYQVRVHLAKLESLEYVARCWGHQGKRCAYELLVDADEPDQAWHIGLLDVDALRKVTATTSCIPDPTSGHFEESAPRSATPSTLVACG